MHIYLAPFSEPDGDLALYVPRTGRHGRISMDPRVAALVAAGFCHHATHGHCVVMFPADKDRARAVLAAAGLS